MKLAVLSYIAPPTFQGADTGVFLDNLKRNPPNNPLVTYSDHDWPDLTIKLKGSPEVLKGAKDKKGLPNKWAVNNFVFFTGLRIAVRNGYSHILYLEADCRVKGKGWDDILFEEYFSHPRALACAGSLVCYNPCNSGPLGFARWNQLVSRNIYKNFPIPTYGWKACSDGSGSSVFPNGAGTIMDIAWMQNLFDLENSGGLAAELFAWDFAIGERLWEKMGPDAYLCVAHLEKMYSSYGDELTKEHERMQMLHDGRAVLVHQVKSSATI